MKTGAPTSDVIAEIGRIKGETIAWQKMSDSNNSPAPAIAEAGSKKR